MVELLKETTTPKHIAENACLFRWIIRQFKTSAESGVLLVTSPKNVVRRADQANDVVGRRLVQIQDH